MATFTRKMMVWAAGLLALGVTCGAAAAMGTKPATADKRGAALQAAMVWAPNCPTGQQAYVAFRKSFELPELPAGPARLDLFADSRYLLWVNGEQVLRGPCRFNPWRLGTGALRRLEVNCL